MKIILTLLMAISFSAMFAQSENGLAPDDRQKPLSLVFNQEEFNGRFSVKTSTDESYDYYVIDLTVFNSWFERVYFMNQTYTESRIVNLDSDLNKEQTWFKTYYTNKEGDINCLFKDLKEKAQQASGSMTPAEQSEWLSKNDKFKK